MTFMLMIMSAFSVFSQTLTYQDLRSVQDEVNKLCPMMIDSDTRLDNCVVYPASEYTGWHMKFQYNYTTVNWYVYNGIIYADGQQANVSDLESFMKQRLTNMIKTTEGLESFRDNKITLVYNYYDKNGKFMFKIDITHDEYE